MKTRQLILTICLTLTGISIVTSCESDISSCDLTEISPTNYSAPSMTKRTRGVDIFRDSIAVAQSTDSIYNFSAPSRDSWVNVSFKADGPDNNGSYLCTLLYKGMCLMYKSIPGGFYPPDTISDRENVWVYFGHSGTGSFELIETGYHYIEKVGNDAQLAVTALYVISYGVSHTTYLTTMDVVINGTTIAAVSYKTITMSESKSEEK